MVTSQNMEERGLYNHIYIYIHIHTYTLTRVYAYLHTYVHTYIHTAKHRTVQTRIMLALRTRPTRLHAISSTYIQYCI